MFITYTHKKGLAIYLLSILMLVVKSPNHYEFIDIKISGYLLLKQKLCIFAGAGRFPAFFLYIHYTSDCLGCCLAVLGDKM
jgi:hypothetical protein